ncbi:hypothetical protein G7Y79_00066g095240 [Physcia stellaris]|nr:hypothetical protein G7Y79_00066g095240 [Physcia stellaris]
MVGLCKAENLTGGTPTGNLQNLVGFQTRAVEDPYKRSQLNDVEARLLIGQVDSYLGFKGAPDPSCFSAFCVGARHSPAVIDETSDPRALEPIIVALTMPETVASDAVWRYDYIEHYNLDKDIISAYLKTIWGNYKFFVERHGDDFRFWVPRRLKKVLDVPTNDHIPSTVVSDL